MSSAEVKAPSVVPITVARGTWLRGNQRARGQWVCNNNKHAQQNITASTAAAL